ncbi:hypothetical protein QJQ45_020680, partial [Haematococcus lacustris]
VELGTSPSSFSSKASALAAKLGLAGLGRGLASYPAGSMHSTPDKPTAAFPPPASSPGLHTDSAHVGAAAAAAGGGLTGGSSFSSLATSRANPGNAADAPRGLPPTRSHAERMASVRAALGDAAGQPTPGTSVFATPGAASGVGGGAYSLEHSGTGGGVGAGLPTSGSNLISLNSFGHPQDHTGLGGSGASMAGQQQQGEGGGLGRSSSKAIAEQHEFEFDPATQIGVGIDPGVTQAHLAAASSAGTSLVANLKHITVTLATSNAVWEVYLDPKWAQLRLRLYGAQDRALEQFLKQEDMAEVSMERHGRAKQLVVFFGAAGIGTGGAHWGEPHQEALPAKGKEYPDLGYKQLRDKPLKAQQQQQPAEAQ